MASNFKTAKDYASYAIDTLKVRESNGKNRSPIIDTWARQFGAELASPYCALGVSYSFWMVRDQSGEKFPYTASSQYVKQYGKENNLYSKDANDLQKWKGACGGWTNPDGSHGHVFLIVGRLTDTSGKVVGIQTEEFNTSLRGDRDGEGGFRLTRRLGADGLWYVEDSKKKLTGPGHSLWFVNTSKFSGGAWW